MTPIPERVTGDSPVMRALFSLAVSLLVACGGSVEREPGTGGSGGTAAATGGSGGGGGSFPSTPLGECEPGFAYGSNADEPCPWIAEGLCYATKLEACACVCPVDHDSWCTSGFPKPGGQPTPVACD